MEEENRELTAVDIVGMAMGMELGRLESGALTGEAYNDCIDNLSKLGRVVIDDDKRETQMYIDQERIKLEREKMEVEKERIEIESQKLEAEEKRQKWSNGLKIAELSLGLATTIGTGIYVASYVYKSMIFEQTGTFRSTSSKMTNKMMDAFIRKFTKGVNNSI